MTTYLLSQEGRNCRVHAAWWTPDGEETEGVVLMPDRRLAARLAHSLSVRSEAVWSQRIDAPDQPLTLPRAMAELGPGSGPAAGPSGGTDRASGGAATTGAGLDEGSGQARGEIASSGDRPPSGATRLRARIAEDEARTIVELTGGLSDDTIAAVKEEIARELAAAAAARGGPALSETDRRWQRFRRIDPVGFLALWAEDDDPSAPFLAWAIGRPVETVADGDTPVASAGDAAPVVTRSVELGEGIEVHITPDSVGDEAVLRIDMESDGETLAYLNIEDVESFGHAGALLTELRERLTPQFLVDAVVRTAAAYRGAPSDEDLEAFDVVVKRLIRLLPAGESGTALEGGGSLSLDAPGATTEPTS